MDVILLYNWAVFEPSSYMFNNNAFIFMCTKQEFVREDEAEEEGFNDDESIQQQQPDLNQLLKMMGEEAPDEVYKDFNLLSWICFW